VVRVLQNLFSVALYPIDVCQIMNYLHRMLNQVGGLITAFLCPACAHVMLPALSEVRLEMTDQGMVRYALESAYWDGATGRATSARMQVPSRGLSIDTAQGGGG